ncbi:MAG TPA: DUF3617 family protein, partial [Caulobacteraceae bacterium]|nr:DUF3617 family protein [Caulobacteraceae bacterium]
PRAGLWQEAVSAEGMKRVMKICMDQAFVDQSKWVASNLMAKGCTSSTSPIAGGWAFKSECDMGSGGRIATEGQATGDFTSHYVVKSSSTTSGAALAQMNRTSSAEVTLDYQGPCPQGWAGGDVEMPGVGRISTGAMMKQAAPSK